MGGGQRTSWGKRLFSLYGKAKMIPIYNPRANGRTKDHTVTKQKISSTESNNQVSAPYKCYVHWEAA